VRYALSADGMEVNGNLILGSGFRAEGEVVLIGAQIRGDMDCTGGNFNSPSVENARGSGRALSAHGTTVKGNVFVRGGFCSNGEVSFSGASIGGNLEGTNAEFRGELNLEAAKIKGALMLSNLAHPQDLQLTLTNASAEALADDAAAWPLPGKIALDGFVYKRFSGLAPKNHKSRLAWVSLQAPFLPAPYRQLAAVLEDEGEKTGSIRVLYELENRLRRRDHRLSSAFLKNPALKWAVGYGYYPMRAFWWLAGLILIGIALYTAAFMAGCITPTEKEAYGLFKATAQLPPHYESFHASIYSVENSLPFLKLGQVEHWQPDPHPQKCVRHISFRKTTFWISLAATAQLYRWIQISFGWILGIFFVGGVTGIIRKS